MQCAVCKRQAQHFWTVQANVCTECAFNLLELVLSRADEPLYRQLLLEAAVMSHRQDLEVKG